MSAEEQRQRCDRDAEEKTRQKNQFLISRQISFHLV
jgi:hypothetical protein